MFAYIIIFYYMNCNKPTKEIATPVLSPTDEIAQLNEKVQMLKAVLASHQIAIWEYDFPTESFLFPDEYFRILGLEKAGIHYQNMDELSRFVHPDDKAFISSEKFKEKIKNCSESDMVTLRCIGNHGEIIWLEDHFFSILKDEKGNPMKLRSYAVNVTSQREKELKIRQLEERNRKIIEALPEFIFIFDDNFFITDVLIANDSILLHPIDQLLGEDGRKIYSPEVSDLFVQNIRECLNDGLLKEIEYPLEVEGKEKHYFQARIVPFEGNKVLALIHDITQRVEHANELVEAKQRAEESDRMKSVFLANMSHEIRTPLNAIVGFSEIIAVTENQEEKDEYVQIIQQNSNLLLQLINDILDLSRIESGKSEMHLQPTDMSAMLEEVGKVHNLKMRYGIELKIERPDMEVWTMTDRNRVTQVLFNFLSNAIKNTDGGSITLGMSIENEWLKLYVKDTGCGIPANKISKIFTHFEKVNEFAQGTGLGLPICKSIIDRLGGRIEVESELGKGSTFAFYLPLYDINEKENYESRPSISGNKRKKILVAEDIESNYMQIYALLNKDYTISWVRNGEEAVNSFLRERPDLILMDIRMPVMNGVDAIAKIRSISIDIPIIAVTANAFLIEQQQALAAGCNDVVAKPYTYELLREKVEKYLK